MIDKADPFYRGRNGHCLALKRTHVRVASKCQEGILLVSKLITFRDAKLGFSFIIGFRTVVTAATKVVLVHLSPMH